MIQLEAKKLLLFLLLFSFGCDSEKAAPRPFLRGMVVSAQTWGKEWATPEMKSALEELRSMGVNAITIHPYARISNNGNLEFDRSPDPDYVRLPMEWARELGMKRMLTPHIGYWGSKFLWRGEITFEDGEERNRYLSLYREWILGQARLAEKYGVEIFVIGLEYGLLQKYESWWRSLIREVREVYHGKITYGANWDEVDKVGFWDALDYVGVLGYFPLTKEANPSVEQIRGGWVQWKKSLRATCSRASKPLLFVEIGYNESAKAAAEPWAFATGGENALEIRKRCVTVALELEKEFPELEGMFFWKWFPNLPHQHPENFDMRSPEVRAVLRSAWGTN